MNMYHYVHKVYYENTLIGTYENAQWTVEHTIKTAWE